SVRRLTKVEYAHSLASAAGLDDIDVGWLADHDPERSTPPPVTPSDVQAYEGIAHSVSLLVAERAERRCQADETCLVDEVKRWGERLYRRPLDPSDMIGLAAVCHAARVRGQGEREAIAQMARVLMLSPRVLYVTERGQLGDRSGDEAAAQRQLERSSWPAASLWPCGAGRLTIDCSRWPRRERLGRRRACSARPDACSGTTAAPQWSSTTSVLGSRPS